MIQESSREQDIVIYWLEKSRESIEAAIDESKAERFSFAVNRIYYACFYSVSALLLLDSKMFKKHSGVRACFHQHIIKTGIMEIQFGQLYDELFEARQRGDYLALISFNKGQVDDWLCRVDRFFERISSIINKRLQSSVDFQ